VNYDTETAEQREIDARAFAAGFPIGPLWHGGTFSPRNGDILFNPWAHFGTASAAEERVGGSGVVDSLFAGIETTEDNGQWYFSIDGCDVEEPYLSEDAARRAAEREALRMAENVEPGEHEFTRVFLRGTYPELPDLGTWGLWDIVKNLPPDCSLTKTEKSRLSEVSAGGRTGDDWALFAELLRNKGVDGFRYKNTVEDIGSTSYMVISPLNIGIASAARTCEGVALAPDDLLSPKQVVPAIDKAYLSGVRAGRVEKAREIVDACIVAGGGQPLRFDEHAGASRVVFWKHGPSTVCLTIPAQEDGVRAVEVSSVRTPNQHSGKGHARKAMEALLMCVDAQQIDAVTLMASPLTKSTRLNRLVGFYDELGFSATGGSNACGHPKMMRQRPAAEYLPSRIYDVVSNGHNLPTQEASLCGRSRAGQVSKKEFQYE